MENVVRCGRCNRVLKTDKSREDGYGPVCLKKVEAEQTEEDEKRPS